MNSPRDSNIVNQVNALVVSKWPFDSVSVTRQVQRVGVSTDIGSVAVGEKVQSEELLLEQFYFRRQGNSMKVGVYYRRGRIVNALIEANDECMPAAERWKSALGQLLPRVQVEIKRKA